MSLINSYGYNGEYFLYTMLNDNFSECYERTHHWWLVNQRLRHGHTGRPVYPYAQPYRDPYDPRHRPTQWQKDMAAWVNKKQCFEIFPFAEFRPRKGFTCRQYLQTLY